jgi:hypothetical protein
MHPTEFPRDFHIGDRPLRRPPRGKIPRFLKVLSAARLEAARRHAKARTQRYSLPLERRKNHQTFRRAAKTEDRKLRKDPVLEVLALKVPFGDRLNVSESSPVAGTIEGANPS